MRRKKVTTATNRTMPRIAARMEPAIIDVAFLLVAFEAMVGDAVSGELVEVGLKDSTRPGSGKGDVVGPGRLVC